MNNKYFSIFLAAFFAVSVFSFGQKNIVILHTNDTHSRIEPVPETDRKAPDKGGVERRFVYIEQVRKENKNVLLFDAGDFLQGTPYFNLFKGKVEVETMNLLKYDAVTLGNHEFDHGLDVLESIVRAAKFPVISTNYDFSQTQLANLVKPYAVFQKDGVCIGVIGINIHPSGLITTANFKGVKFLDPISTANEMATELRSKHNCDMVVCLSHLGYTDDINLAQKSRNIDIIVGGHSHTYMKEPDVRKNLDNKDVLIHQTAGRGIYVGRIDVALEKIKK